MKSTPAIQRFFDPYSTTGYGTINLVQGFGFGDYSPAFHLLSFSYLRIFKGSSNRVK